MPSRQYDVVIFGTGLAGLTLCRQLQLRDPEKRVLLLDNRQDLPGKKQKVGESLVQVGGYYFSKVLDLEEHLLREHYLKYNLRFYWKTDGASNRNFEDYSQSYIRQFSNVCSYQLNRNLIEEHLLHLNLQNDRCTALRPALKTEVGLSKNCDPHRVSFEHAGERHQIEAGWVVDTTGRGQLLKRARTLQQESPIQNGASWCWVEGLVNIEKLTEMSHEEMRKKADRRRQGSIPLWLATNHFCGEGFWFWVIPLQGITSLGVVYDPRYFDPAEVSTAEKLIDWACREFPLFDRDLPDRKIVDSARLLSYAYDCQKTISHRRWAMSGMSGRFSDPLYSPGSDLIGFYNTLIVDAILTEDSDDVEKKCQLYEPLMKVFYEAYVPSYSVSYNALGDQEVFTLKYTWELTIYFGFYVFPFLNDLFTRPTFIQMFFRKFSRLGRINRNLQEFLSAYAEWRKEQNAPKRKVLHDFSDLAPLKEAEKTFYEFSVSDEQAEEILENQLENLMELARFYYAWISSQVLGDENVFENQAFIQEIGLSSFRFDPDRIRTLYQKHTDATQKYSWNLNPAALQEFR